MSAEAPAHSSASSTSLPSAPSLPRRTLLAGAGALPLGVLAAGCQGGSSSAGGDGVPQVEYEQGSAALQVELGSEIDGVPYPEGYVGPRARESEPFSDGSTEFTILTRSESGMDIATNAHTLWLEEQTGVHITYQTVPQGEEGTPKITSIISSGDLPDAFLLGPEWMGGFTKSQLWAYGQQGLFQPLDELIDENAPQLQELFEQLPDLRAQETAPDGAMYGMPSINQCYHCCSTAVRTFVHRPSMEAAGWSEQPRTLDEFEQMLRDMKAADPMLRPMSGDKDTLPFGLIGAAFMDIGVNWLRRDGDSIVYTPTDPQFREIYTVVARLVRDGLLDPNAFTQDNDQFKRLTMDPAGSRIGVAQALHHHSLLDVELTPDARWHEFDVLEPFSGPGGDPVVPWNENYGEQHGGLVITSACEDPATLVRWADFQLGLIPSISFNMGRLGEHWDWAAPGQKGIDGRQAIHQDITEDGEKPENTGWPEISLQGSTMDRRHGEAVNEQASIEPELYRAGALYEPYRNSPESLFIPPFFTLDQSAEVGELRTNIDGIFAQGAAKMCLGDLDPTDDADWEAYLEPFMAAGVERYLEVLGEADRARA